MIQVIIFVGKGCEVLKVYGVVPWWVSIEESSVILKTLNFLCGGC